MTIPDSERRLGAPKGRLALVSAYFTPSRRIGARRPARFARALHARGWEVTVVTLGSHHMQPLDPDAREADPFEVIRTSALLPGTWLRAAAGALSSLRPWSTTGAGVQGEKGTPKQERRRAERHAGPVERWLARWEFPDRWRGWTGPALRAVTGREFDVVLATTPPFTALCIGAEIARRCRARLTLDYRDPWLEAPRLRQSGSQDRGYLERHRQLEDGLLAQADLVTSASLTVCRWLQARGAPSPMFLPNTCRQADAPGTPAGQRRNEIFYMGSLGYGRSLRPVLRAMRQMSQAGSLDGLRLVYAGEEGERLLREAEELGVDEAVQDLGSIQRSSAMERVRDALLGLVVTSEGYEYNIPGKMVEYLSVRTPMLLLAPAGAEAAEIFRRYGLGAHCLPEDVDGIVRCVERARRGDLRAPDAPPELRTEEMMGELDRALTALLHRP